MLDQLRKFEAPPEVLAAAEARLQAEAQAVTIPVWPENWHAVRTFVAMATQWHWVVPWRCPPARTGLRLEALPAVLPAVQPSVPRRLRKPYAELVAQLQAMEDAALAEFAKQRQ